MIIQKPRKELALGEVIVHLDTITNRNQAYQILNRLTLTTQEEVLANPQLLEPLLNSVSKQQIFNRSETWLKLTPYSLSRNLSTQYDAQRNSIWMSVETGQLIRNNPSQMAVPQPRIPVSVFGTYGGIGCPEGHIGMAPKMASVWIDEPLEISLGTTGGVEQGNGLLLDTIVRINRKLTYRNFTTMGLNAFTLQGIKRHPATYGEIDDCKGPMGTQRYQYQITIGGHECSDIQLFIFIKSNEHLLRTGWDGLNFAARIFDVKVKVKNVVFNPLFDDDGHAYAVNKFLMELESKLD